MKSPPKRGKQGVLSLLTANIKDAFPTNETNAPISLEQALAMRDMYNPSNFTDDELAQLRLFAQDNERRAPFYVSSNLMGGSDYAGAASGYVPRMRSDDPEALRREQSEVPRDWRLPESYMRRVDSAATANRVALRQRKK